MRVRRVFTQHAEGTMRGYDGYDREMRRGGMRGYDRPLRGRYDRDHRGYDRGFARSRDPWTGWYPGAYWAGAPLFGFGGMEAWGWPPYAPIGMGEPPRPPRRRPRESAAYGRGGDRAVRRWAERYGYDIEYSIRPRRAGPGRERHGDR